MSADTQYAVRKLGQIDIDPAADLLTRAFFDYPAWTWFVPEPNRRRELMGRSMRMTMRWGLLMDETYGTSPDGGIAVWMPPGTPDDIDPDGTLTGWNEFAEAAGPAVLERFDIMSEAQKPVRDRAAGDQPHWYLPWLGVDPGSQRTGAGTALLQHMFDRLDRDGAICILETEQHRNVAYYERHGFSLAHHGTLPLDGPEYWTMLREPRTPRSV